MHRLAMLTMAGVLAAAGLGGCASATELEVEGTVLSRTSWSADACDDPERCAAIAAAATRELLAREPGVEIARVRFHAPADDGVVASMERVHVVFTLANGSVRLESFACGPHGLTDPPRVAYAEFCPAPG